MRQLREIVAQGIKNFKKGLAESDDESNERP